MIRIDERTVRRLSGQRVAVGNIWHRSPADGGLPRPSARIFVGQTPPEVVFEGSVVELAGTSWRVVEVCPAAGATGHIIFEPA